MAEPSDYNIQKESTLLVLGLDANLRQDIDRQDYHFGSQVFQYHWQDDNEMTMSRPKSKDKEW